MKTGLFHCVCLSVAGLMVIGALATPQSCNTRAEPANAEKTKRAELGPAAEVRQQCETLEKTANTLGLIRLLIEKGSKKTKAKNNGARTSKNRPAISGGNVGNGGRTKAPDQKMDRPGVGKVRR